MKTIFTLIIAFCAFSATAGAQAVSISPTSFRMWGATPAMGEFSVQYRNAGIHYFHAWQVHTYNEYRHGYNVLSSDTQSALAVSWTPVSIRDIFRGGAILFHRNFPIRDGAKLNFLLEFGYGFDHFRIAYMHISNGFGAFNKWNPGVDHIRLSYFFH